MQHLCADKAPVVCIDMGSLLLSHVLPGYAQRTGADTTSAKVSFNQGHRVSYVLAICCYIHNG